MMKLTALTLALLFTSYPTQQEPRIITCTVVEVDKSVACPEEGKMVLFTFVDEADAKKTFDQWRLRAPLQGERANADAPLYSVPVNVGDKVKAIIGSEKFAVSECNVRVWERVKANYKPGEIPSNMLFTQPDDCQPWYGDQR